MGTDPAQALTLICDYDKSKLYLISVNLQGLSILNVPVSIDWAMLVAYHRGRMESIDICKRYRREGKFFDEILDEARNGGVSWTQSH